MAKLHELTGNSVDSTTAPQSSVSSLNKVLISDKLLSLVGKLSDIDSRGKTSTLLAKLLGAENFFVFIKDRELGVLLPALGFPQTLPDGKIWNAFLENCVKNKKYQANLPYPNRRNLLPAVGYAYKNDCVFVLLGGKAAHHQIDQLTFLLPLITSVFRYEQEVTQKETDMKISEKSVSDSQGIARKLDIARRDLQTSLIEKEKEIEFKKRAEKESKHAKAKIAREQKRLINLFMNAPAIIGVLRGPDHVYELANPLYMQLIGKHRSILGKSIREALPELKGQGIYELLDQVYRTGEPFFGNEISVKLDRKGNGKLEECYFNFVYQPSFGADERVDGILVHAIEITEQVQSRKKLEESERKLRALADNIPNLAWMAKADGYIYWYNSRWYEYTGTTPAEMEGWGWQSTHDPDVLPIVLKKWKASIKSGKKFEMVFPLKGADNIFRPFLTRVVPIYDENQKIVHWFGTNTDITKQKQLERQKDDFLGIASHELKTPVTSIKAYGQVLQMVFRRKGDLKAVEHLEKMDAQIDKLTSLISDLLDVTKIQSGRMEFHEDFFDFNELVNELVEQLQLTTEKHTLVKELGKTISVYGDRDRTGQVITNLISNAVKYSPHSKKIIIKTSSDKNNLTLCVQDFGVGIPRDKQGSVFEQFYRVSGAKETTFPGLGLGLYVSSEIIKREGGKIWVESEEGKGSTFYFSLPLNKKAKKQQKNTLKEMEVQHG
ncbi:MAG TPA: PAS domain-containing sensor histidine kinase [Xanthomonadales bacterium]|nr:PAS domain-containing sensor histidine kinase [Xanthomonadales bacterium]